MSDVKVKFGAEDVGLEKTLKSVQTELGQLQTKVKSGDLSMSELESTMKRIGQVESLEKRLKGMGGEAAQTSPKINELGDEAKTMGNKAEDAGDKGGTGLGKIGIAAGVAGAAFAAGMKVLELAADAARAVVDKFGDAINLGADLDDLSSRTGETAGNLVLLQRAFVNAGVSSDNVGTAVNKLQKFMDAANDSSSKQAELMGSLGISMADLEGKTPTEQMQIFAQKIAGIQDPTSRAATAMQIFGKSGGELLPLLNNFSTQMEGARNQLGSLPGVMDRSAAAFGVLSENFETIGTKTKEFAAGFIEAALPALNKFTSALTGVDAAGWGQKIGEVAMRVADFLIGAFKSPMSIIELYGLQLNLNARTFGNLLLNGFITAGNFFKEFFSSQLPSLLIGQLTTSLMKGFADGLKFFVDNIGSVVTSFREYFGKAVESIASFFTETFNKIVGFFANDFQNAMSNPIDFISGKLNSALSSATKNGSLVFKDEYDNASGSVIDRISQGLGAVSKTYANDLEQSTQNIGAEWDKVAGNLSISTQDFFGAEPAANRVADKFKEVEETGKKFREDFEASTENASKNTEVIPLHLQDAENSSAGINANLSGAGRDLKNNTSVAKDNMQQIKTIGDLIAAQDAAKPMRSFKEESAAVRADLKALKEFIGEDLSKMSWPDIAKKMGIDRTKKEQKELFDEIKERLEEIKNTEIDLKINGDASMEELERIKQNIATIGLEDIVLTFDAPLSDIASGLAELASSERELDLTADGALSEIASALPGYFENPLSLEFDADSSIQEVESSLNTLGSEPVEVKLNASSGIENIRNELSKEIDLGLSSSKGTDILNQIKPVIEAIRDLVTKLEQKLPQSALGY
jgi:hypothetical protein